jgi:hypothetical protein
VFIIVAFIVALGTGMMAYRATTGYRTEIRDNPRQRKLFRIRAHSHSSTSRSNLDRSALISAMAYRIWM